MDAEKRHLLGGRAAPSPSSVTTAIMILSLLGGIRNLLPILSLKKRGGGPTVDAAAPNARGPANLDYSELLQQTLELVFEFVWLK